MNVNAILMEQNVSQFNGGITINVTASVKKHHVCEKYYVWNPATCNCENWKYLPSIMDDLAIKCDEIMKSFDEEIKPLPTNFNEKKVTCKIQNLYILLAFLLITIALLIAVSKKLPKKLRICENL